MTAIKIFPSGESHSTIRDAGLIDIASRSEGERGAA